LFIFKIDSSNSPAPVIVTRTLSTSNVRNASSTIVQTTPTTCSSSSTSSQLPNLYSRTSNPSSSSVGVISSYHPITTELWKKNLFVLVRVFNPLSPGDVYIRPNISYKKNS